MEKELYRLHSNSSGSEGLTLDEIAIRARIEDVSYRLRGHHAWNTLKMSINDIRDIPSDKTFDDAEEALAMFVMRNGVSALVNKVVKMCADEFNAQSFRIYEETTGEKTNRIGPTCVWCEDHNCANCPYVETPKGKKIQWYKSDGKVKHIK